MKNLIIFYSSCKCPKCGGIGFGSHGWKSCSNCGYSFYC